MTNNQKGRFRLAKEVKDALKLVNDNNPSLKGTGFERWLLSLPKKALESPAKKDFEVSLELLGENYNIPSEQKDALFAIRKASMEWNGKKKLQEYWENAENGGHINQENIRYFRYPPELIFVKELSEELGIDFDEARAKKIYQRMQEEYSAVYSKILNDMEGEYKDNKDIIRRKEREYGDMAKKNIQKLKDMRWTLKYDEKMSKIGLETSELEKRASNLQKLFLIKPKLVGSKFKRTAKKIAVAGLIGLLSFATGYCVSNSLSEKKINKLYDKINQKSSNSWMNDSLIDTDYALK